MDQKTERPVLDRPLKVGGGIQPLLVTVLTPATTVTVGGDCSQNRRAVNSTSAVIYNFYEMVMCEAMLHTRSEWRSRRDSNPRPPT